LVVGGQVTIFAIIPNPQIKKSSSFSLFVIIILLVAQSAHSASSQMPEKTPVFFELAITFAPGSLLYFLTSLPVSKLTIVLIVEAVPELIVD
jgi:hypothetical protein